MAAFTVTDVSHQSKIVTWTLTTADHTGDWLELPDSADRSIQFDDTGGAWGSATAALEGTNDIADGAATMSDPQGNAISKTSDAIEGVLENVRYYRPRLTTVGSGATVYVTMLMRNPR